jgi:hypothetical protein
MIGTKERMPKGARYPLFLLGLTVVILGSILANSRGAAPLAMGGIVAIGFALLVTSVLIK